MKTFFLNLVTTPLSWFFAGLVFLKNFLYDNHILRAKRLGAPVISVGNLSMGGSGKSPIVGSLLYLLQAGHRQVAVLSRGYGRRDPGTVKQVEREGHWLDYGDEPMMLAQAHPGVTVWVGANRFQTGSKVVPTPDVFVLDDGFQHRQLARDFDIVVLDVQQGWPQLFPRGLFREGWSALRRAHAVVLTRTEGVDLQPWRDRIEAAHPGLPIFCPRFRVEELRVVKEGRKIHPQEIPGGRIAAYAGIARPEKFFQSLASLGLEVVISESLADHGVWTPPALARFLERCRSANLKYVVTTEKDAVKLENQPESAILLCSLSLTVDWGDEQEITRVLNQLFRADA